MKKQQVDAVQKLVTMNNQLCQQVMAIVADSRMVHCRAFAELAAEYLVRNEARNGRIRAHMRNRDFFAILMEHRTERCFKSRLRINKQTFRVLCDELRILLERENTVMCTALSVEERVAICLYFLGSTSEYRAVADLFGVGESTVCETVHEVCRAICAKLQDDNSFSDGVNNYNFVFIIVGF